jgi:hypothetical protein
LRSWCPTEMIQPPDHLEHRTEGKPSHAVPEALMRPEAEMHIQV